jgi:hypothetical protein
LLPPFLPVASALSSPPVFFISKESALGRARLRERRSRRRKLHTPKHYNIGNPLMPFASCIIQSGGDAP